MKYYENAENQHEENKMEQLENIMKKYERTEK